MDKRIDGTFVNQELVIEEINHLIKEEGYAPEQLLVLTRKAKNDFITTETGVQVVLTGEDHDDDSLWDKIVNFFTVDMDEEEEEKIFESYGIDEDTYERFEDAMENGELLLLIDDAAPVNDEHADFLVREGIIPDEHAEEKKAMATQPDWAADDTAKGDMPPHAIEAEKESQAVAAGMMGSQADMKEPVLPEDVKPMVHEEAWTADDMSKGDMPLPVMEAEKESPTVAAGMMESQADMKEPVLPEEAEPVTHEEAWTADDMSKGDMPLHVMEAEKESPTVAAGMTESQADMKEPVLPEEAKPVTHEEMNEMVVRDEYEVAEITKEKTAAVSGEIEKQPDLKDIVTDQPIKTEAVAGDPTMAEDNHEMADMQFDKEESLPEMDETDEQYSKDPFGGDTVAAEEGEDAEDIPPVYENPDKKRPAL